MKAFIFDLDGTLADTVPLIVATARRVWQEYGLYPDEARIRSFIGVSLFQTGEAVLGPGRGQEYVEAYQRHYHAQPRCIQPFAGVPEMLRELRRQGTKLAVCTSKRERSATETLQQTGIAPLLDAVVHSEMTAEHKPDAAPARCAMQLLALPPAECLFIGDSIHDIGCGHHAGMAACAVSYGAATAETLRGAAPEYLVSSVPALRELLLSLLQK